MKTIYLAAACAICAWVTMPSMAQTDSTKVSDLTELSLEDLMNIPIESASREKEDVFDAPVTSYVITRQDIDKSGSLTVMEALRLCPALFVTEVSNGVFSIDIRGLNAIPGFDGSNSNRTLLVMIDNRPIFNQFQGGTFWESFPVDINDVERIEVVAGPSSALFGPNAATGVINIITKRLNETGLYAYANTQGAHQGSYLANGSIGYNFNSKLSVMGTFNHQMRFRSNQQFYELSNDRYVDLDSLSSGGSTFTNYRAQFPHPERSLEKTGYNLYLNYKAAEDIKFDVSAGMQNATVMNFFLIDGVSNTTFMNQGNNSTFGRARADIKGFSTQFSYINGNQSILEYESAFQYNFSTLDYYIDYNLKVTDNLKFKPAFNYQQASINDKPYTVDANPAATGIFNNNATMNSMGFSLRGDYNMGSKLRIVAAARGDKFKYPADKVYLSYQAAINYKPGAKHNIRLVASRAWGGSFIFNSYGDFQLARVQVGPGQYYNRFYYYDRNIDPIKVDMYELGYRLKLSNVSFDASLFTQVSTNYSPSLLDPTTTVIDGSGVNINQNLVPTTLDLKAQQTGFTLAMNSYWMQNKLQFRPYVTIQETRLKNFSPYYYTPGAEPAGQEGYNTERQFNIVSKATPSVYGGFILNYAATDKLNFNIQGYYFHSYRILGQSDRPIPGVDGDHEYFHANKRQEIPAKMILNLKVSYKVLPQLSVFVNARNLTNDRIPEFYASDRIGAMYMGGLTFELK